MESNQKKRFSFFRNTDRPDAIAEDTTPTLSYFFKLLGRKFGKLMSLNLMMMVLFLPLLAILFIYLFGPKAATIDSPLHAPLLGVALGGQTPVASAFIGLFADPLNVPAMKTGHLVVMLVLLLITVLTWGWQNVGATYNLRSLVRGDSCFLFSDYFYAIRRNLKQGFLFGILDFAIIAVLLFDLYYFSTLAGIFAFGVMYVMMIALFVIYTFMRFYIYHMMITFDLSIRKLLKNALIFSMLGIKRNLAGFFGIALVAVINVAIIVPCLSVGFSVPLVLPLFYFPALAGFIAAYAAFPNIQRYMIDPYQSSPDGDDEEVTPPEAD